MSTLDPRAVLRELGVVDATSLEPVAGGRDTAIWRVERPAGACALRVFRPAQAGVVGREVSAMRAAHAAGLPVPGVLAIGSFGQRDDARPALLLEWCAGETLRAALQRRPWTIWRLGVRFGSTHARIHRIAAPPELLSAYDWYGAPDAAIGRRLDASGARTDRLLHLDYHPLNVLIHGGRLSAVLDWTNARAGDARADVARSLTILRLTPLPPGAVGRFQRLFLRLLEAAWWRGYRREAGPIGALRPFLGWAAELLARDLSPRVGRDHITPAALSRIRAWGVKQAG